MPHYHSQHVLPSRMHSRLCFFTCCECRGVVASLHQMGMKCVLLTGDNWRTARAIADQV